MADKNKKIEYTPTMAIPPGDTLAETLEERGMTQAELAKRVDRPLKTINEIIKGMEKLHRILRTHQIGCQRDGPPCDFVGMRRNCALGTSNHVQEECLLSVEYPCLLV